MRPVKADKHRVQSELQQLTAKAAEREAQVQREHDAMQGANRALSLRVVTSSDHAALLQKAHWQQSAANRASRRFGAASRRPQSLTARRELGIWWSRVSMSAAIFVEVDLNHNSAATTWQMSVAMGEATRPRQDPGGRSPQQDPPILRGLCDTVRCRLWPMVSALEQIQRMPYFKQ